MKKVYFASDFHLGIPDKASSFKRELEIVAWLESIRHDAEEIFLVGDVFDFWFEYGSVVPKGYIRLLGKIAEIADSGIPIHWFTGNHDMWIFDYIPSELNITLHTKPVVRTFGGKKFFIGHGDGLGPGDYGYKLIKKVFANSICRFLFRWIHPDIGTSLARFWSGTSRAMTAEERFLGEDKEFLMVFCKEKLASEHFDYLIFGHRHLALNLEVGKSSRYINLGEWLFNPHYAAFDGTNLELIKVHREATR